MHTAKRIRDVAEEILRYLQRHPEASDTFEGIVEWWIPRVRLEEEAEVVERAIALLLESSRVESISLDGSNVMYRLAQEQPGVAPQMDLDAKH